MYGTRTETFTGAFQELYPRARRLAQRILGNRAAAEDVAAEAMTRAYAHWSEIGGSVSHRTGWVLRVTTNLAIDGVRGKERPAELTGAHFPPVADVQDGLTLRLTLTQALRELPRRQREAVVLHYLAGLTQAEVAKALEISPGSVARHVHRGLAALRAQLPDEVTIIRGGGRTMRVKTMQEASRLVGTDQLVTAKVTGQLGGTPLYTVDIGMSAVLMLPGQAERRPATGELVGQELDCVVAEVDERRSRVLVAKAPAGAEAELHERRKQVLSGLRRGDARTGTVISLVPFGAFVDIGDQIYGLLHKSELGDVGHPSEKLTVGQTVEVEIDATSPATERVSLRLPGAERGVDE